MAKTNLFLTGGTGFVGRWIIKTLQRDHPDIDITVLTRSPEVNEDLKVEFLRGDVETFEFPKKRFDFIVHCSVEGTHRILKLCKQNDATMLYTSSGAVYGRQPTFVPIPESAHRVIDTEYPYAQYSLTKLDGEAMCMVSGLKTKIARLFTFAGGGMQLHRYAIGNFIRDAEAGKPIVVHGKSGVYRSYMHPSEMAEWCMKILFDGDCRPYNVGSSQPVEIHALAADVASYFGCEIVCTPTETGKVNWYVPDTTRAMEFGLVQNIPYPDVLYRMIKEVTE